MPRSRQTAPTTNSGHGLEPVRGSCWAPTPVGPLVPPVGPTLGGGGIDAVGGTATPVAPTAMNDWPVVGVQMNVATTASPVPSLRCETIFMDVSKNDTSAVPLVGVHVVSGRSTVATNGCAFLPMTLMV